VIRGIGLAILLLIAVAAGAWWWSTRAPPEIVWQGYADADFVMVGPTQQGRLTAVYVQRGDEVTAGARLFDQDAVFDGAARDQAAQLLAQAEGQLANLLAGGKVTEIEQAQENLADARATLTRTTADLKRGEALLPNGAVTKQVVDQYQAAYLSALARVAALQAALAQALEPLGRDQEVEAQRAAVKAAHAALDQAAWRLAQRYVAAPTGGRVADVLARPGETIAAGAPVVSLLPPGNIFVRFFIPERDLAMVHYGDPVRLACDGCANGLFATISFISPQAEYTPPLIYSEQSKAKLVFLIEARPAPDQATLLNPGEPMEVRPAGTRSRKTSAP
jgi:HlyD family secretion protein